MARDRKDDTVSGARALVVLLGFVWGFQWIATAIALHDIPPWTLRTFGIAGGTLTLLIAALFVRADLHVPKRERIHVMIGSFLNLAAFHILGAYSQLHGATSRTIIISYSMPIWATLFSLILLKERLDRVRVVAFMLCLAGLAILVWPLFGHGVPVFVFYSLAAAVCWAFGTVYMKWMRVTVPPLASAFWQLLFSFIFLGSGMLIFEGLPHFHGVGLKAVLGLGYIAILGTGLAHFLWWSINGKVSPVTASIGALLVPVIGVTASALILGERPTPFDIVGFALIFAAAASVLLTPAAKPPMTPD
ncbi:MAG: EamA family transporter [Proteobacteria bacterium]|nr:EamA family transporter [Pseudomonadota bacterium]